MISTDGQQPQTLYSKMISIPLPYKMMAAKLCLLGGAFIFAISKMIPIMMKVWSRPDYSHGFLIPFISLYLIWFKREKLRELPVLPNYAGGAALLILGSSALILGTIGSVAIVQLASVIVMITGLILLLLGTGYLRALSLPVAYLVFSVPILDLIYFKISYPLQLFFSKSASLLLTQCNVPVFQHAQYIELPSVMLEVAPECSGINFLVSFLAIGIPLAYFTQKSLLRRISLVVFAVFCCISANLLRIFLIGFWSYHGGEFVHGPFHIFVGAFIGVVGYIFLFLGAWFFAEATPPKLKKLELDTNYLSTIIPDMKIFNRAFLLSFIILLGTGGYLYLDETGPVSLGPVHEFDAAIGEWEGSHADFNIRGLEIRGADSEITRSYKDAKGREVKLYTGYFASQTQGKEMIFYTLQDLYNNTEETVVTIGPDKAVHVNKALLSAGPGRVRPVLYWYDVQGKIIANRYIAKFVTALNGLFRKGTNGALVMVYSDEKDPEQIEQALHDELDFIKVLMPALANYLPGH
jgi:EpsI family protein